MQQFRLPGTFAPIASPELMLAAVNAAKQLDTKVMLGNVFTTDCFYDDAQSLQTWVKMGVLAVEMETAGLYAHAARAGKKALTLCTISDLPFTGEECPPAERENTFTQMMEIALEIA